MAQGDAVAAAGRVTVRHRPGDVGGHRQPSGPTWPRALGPLRRHPGRLPDTAWPRPIRAHLDLAQPFQLAFGHGRRRVAAAVRRRARRHFAADPGQDPALAANQLLADLAFIHYEAPNASNAPRGLIAVPPSGWSAEPTFDDALLAGLATTPSWRRSPWRSFFARGAGGRHDD